MAKSAKAKRNRAADQGEKPKSGRPRRSALKFVLPESAAYVAMAHEAVRTVLAASAPLGPFLQSAPALTPADRARLIDQAIVLLEGFYVHLPLKRAMHAVEPLQRLRLFRKRLAQVESDTAFHAEMTRIFTSVRDLHTNYLLPAPFSRAIASLPFRIEACVEGGERRYIVAGVATGFSHPTFQAGVELLYWSGVPMERAVEAAADEHAGSNLEARRARGLAGLTQRPLIVSPAPDEEWVIVGYRAADGSDHEERFDWLVSDVPPDIPEDGPDPASAFAMGVDLETELVQQARRMLFAPQVQAAEDQIAAASDAMDAVSGLESTMPKVLRATKITTKHGEFGHIRVWTFSVPRSDADAFVAEFIRLVEQLPQNGLIVDVRDNGGGLIYAGEQLLQVLTPRTIEPERLQFINTPSTLRLCELNDSKSVVDLTRWLPSVQRAIETGAAFSASYPISSVDKCNAIGQRYYGPVVLITSARCYSTTDIFSAGFQDHAIGPILGVDGNTGAGGANVWQHDLLNRLFSTPDLKPVADSPIKPLPKGAGMRVSVRRTLRVGPQAGTELEDLGVTPDFRHGLTRADILNGNVDLFDKAGELLAAMPVYGLTVEAKATPGGKLSVKLGFQNVDRIDLYLDGRPRASRSVPAAATTLTIDLDEASGASGLLVQGFGKGQLVACRRLAV